MNASLTGLTEAVRTMGQSVSKARQRTWESGCQSWTHLSKTLTIGTSHSSDMRVRSILPILPCWKQRDNHQQWWWRILLYLLTMRTQRRTESREESWKQRFRSLQTIVLDVRNVRSGRQHGTIRANHDVQVRFQDWRRGRPSERISETGEAIRWGERYWSRSRPRKTCIISNTPELLKSHLRLNVAKGNGESKSKVTEISESDSSKQVEESWTLTTSTQQPSLSQVNTIGCSDEGLWIFSLEHSKKRRNTLNWQDQSDWKTEEHELMIDSGCFGHVCPPWFAPQFPMVSSTNVDAVAANNVALQHYGQNVVYGHVMTNSGRRLLDPGHIWRDERAQTFLELFCTETSWRHNHLQSWLWLHHFFERDSEFGVSRLSFIFQHHSDEWNTSSQRDGDGWRECDKWRGWGSLRQRWSRETWGSRSFSWWSTSNRRCGSSLDSLILLVKRNLQEYYVLLNHRQMLREWHTTRHTFNSEIGARPMLRVADEVLRTDELWWTRPRIRCRNSRQASYSFEQLQRSEFSHVSHSWKRSVEQWSASCAFGNVVLRIWRRKSLDILKLTVSSIRSFFNATKRRVSLMRVEQLHANETWEQLYDLR